MIFSNNVFACIKHNLYVGRVCGAGAVMVDLPTRILVTCHELSHKVIDAGVVTCLWALVVAKSWERCNWLGLDLLSKKIPFVQKQDDGRLFEEHIFADFLEQIQGFDLRGW